VKAKSKYLLVADERGVDLQSPRDGHHARVTTNVIAKQPEREEKYLFISWFWGAVSTSFRQMLRGYTISSYRF